MESELIFIKVFLYLHSYRLESFVFRLVPMPTTATSRSESIKRQSNRFLRSTRLEIFEARGTVLCEFLRMKLQ
jgi:hypothetical protein